MTGSTRSSGGLDKRRRRLLFRCWHRGTREMDLILGRFADAEIASLADDELAQLERLIEVPDPDLYAAVTGDKALPPEFASRLPDSHKPVLVLPTVNAIVQRVPAREVIAAQALSIAPGHVVPMDSIVSWLEHNGYNRSSTVREPGEYAVRGGILDLFPAGLDQPVRFDFFGDSLESIRSFDAETQRTLLDMRSLDLVPISEFQLVTETIRRFRMGYVAAFGAPERDDPLYEAVSEGRRHPGMEHWLPLFAERMDTLFDYLGDAPLAIEPQGEDAARERFKQIGDYYEARREAMEHPGGGVTYKPLPPNRLYLTDDEWSKRLGETALARLTQFAVPDDSGVVDAGARQGRD